MVLSFNERLMRAIQRLGKTEAERAKKLGYTVRQIDNWEKGEGLAKVLEHLENVGVIAVVDEPVPTEPAEVSAEAA